MNSLAEWRVTRTGWVQVDHDAARVLAHSVNTSVVLIDGDRLASLMITHGVGVQSVQSYTVVEVDEDYFE